jgi:hypothetical protein
VANNYTPQTWAVAVLQRLGYQPSRGAVQSLVGWARAEGGHWNNQARYNPLNTTQPEPGAGNTGSQGNIKVYRDWNQGIDATVKTLRNGRYGQILSGLRSGDPARVADAIGQTPWGTSGDLVRRTILGTKVSHIPSGGGGGSTAAPSSTTTTTSTTPGVDNSSLRRQLVAGFLAQGGVKNTEATATFAAAYRNAQDVPGQTSRATSTSTSPSPSPSTGGSGPAGSKVLELIHNDGGKGYGIKNGQVVNGQQVFAGVWAGHADHVHVAAGPKTVVALGKLAQSMGLHVGENPHFGGVNPVHVPGSFHYKGEAIDVSGDPRLMDRYARAVERYNRTRQLPQ